GEREFESGQRIDHYAPGLEPVNRRGQLVLRLVDRKIQRSRMDDAHLAVANGLVKPDGAGLCILARALLEDGDDARFAATDAFANEVRGEDRLPRSGRSGDEDGLPGGNTADQ